jgi:hypothetical protein
MESDVAGSAKEPNVKGLSVVVVVSVGGWVTTFFAWPLLDPLVGLDAGENLCPVFGIVGVSLSSLGFDPFGVPFVEASW